MNLSKLFFVLSISTLIGCKSEVQQKVTPEKTQVELDSLSKERVQVNLMQLSPESEKDLASFNDFQNLKALIKTLHQSNPFFIKKYADSLDLLVQTMGEDLTDDYKTNPITSRLTVLKTVSGQLNEQSIKYNPDAETLLNFNTRLIDAYNSLVIQFNELSLAIPENIEKELLMDQKDLRDSIDEPDAPKN